jgi:hypothetical protein
MPATFQYPTHSGEEPPEYIERAFRFHCSYAGLHDFSFVKYYDGFDDGWKEVNDDGSWSVLDGILSGSAPDGSVVWNENTQSIPEQFVVEVDKSGGSGGIAFWRNISSFYYVYWEANEVGVGQYSASGYTKLFRAAINGGEDAHVKLVCSNNLFETYGDVVNFISLFFDNKQLFTYAISGTLSMVNRLGFLSFSSDEAIYSNLDVPMLGERVPWQNIDIGQPTLPGLQRVLEGRGIKWMVRYNGEIKTWKPVSTVSVATIPTKSILSWEQIRDWRTLSAHDRVVGGFYEVNTYDSDWYNKFGHRFSYSNNPTIESQADTYDAGIRNLREAKESYQKASVVIHANPLLEIGDHITVGGYGDWIIEEIVFGIELGKLVMTLTMKKYIDAS